MDTTYNVIKSMFEQNSGYEANHFIHESFDDFVSDKIPRIIEEQNPIEVSEENKTLWLRIKDPFFEKPTFPSGEYLMPQDARLRNADYSMKLKAHCEIEVAHYDEKTNTMTSYNSDVKNIDLGYIPLMVGSPYCWLSNQRLLHDEIIERGRECLNDYFGYFIVNGAEKMLVCQDKIAENKTMIFDKNKNSTNGTFVAEVMSTDELAFEPPKKIQLTRTPSGIFATKMHNIRDKKTIPVAIIFRALGIENEYDIVRYIMMNKENDEQMYLEIKTTLLNTEASSVRTQVEALDYLSNYTSLFEDDDPRWKARELMRADFLPHVSKNWDRHSCHLKALYLGYMIARILRYLLGYDDADDRDSMINKRVETPGNLMASLFQQSFKHTIINAKKMFKQKLRQDSIKKNMVSSYNISIFIRHQDITNQLKRGLTTGDWSAKNSNQSVRKGIAQPVNRQNFIASLSYMLRVNTNLEKQNGCVIKPRKLHQTQWGYLCPFETPEGKNIGLVKNLAIASKPTTYIDETFVYKKLWEAGVQPATSIDVMKQRCWVDVNGCILGWTDEPKNIYQRLKWMKCHGILHTYTSIIWKADKDSLSIRTDNGRLVRPVFILYNNETGITSKIAQKICNNELTWNNLVHPESYHDPSLLDRPLIEYIDPDETTQLLIATDNEQVKRSNPSIQYTHMEIHKSFIFGSVVNITPFVNHNQAPRNSYQTAMTKQAIGHYVSNYDNRFDKTATNILTTPQKPIVGTIYDTILPGMKDMPAGMNIIIAVIPFGGYNQEDSIIMNNSAVQRGLFSMTNYMTYHSKIQMDEASSFKERFIDPRECGAGKDMHFNFNKLNSYGFVEENTPVEPRDVIIGKACPRRYMNNSKEYYWTDESVAIRENEFYTVDKVAANNRYFKTQDSNRSEFIKVRLRAYRPPKVGDKYTSRAAQKGLVGNLINEEDMPRTEEGITPDLIVNSNAFPSRMTCSQLLEMVLGKNCALRGEFGDGTVFRQISEKDVGQDLEDVYGFQRYGDEVLYNGETGNVLQGDVFIGITYYQRLKHMVDDKWHARGQTGPSVPLTRQPAEGRARKGGYRLGELEVWSLFASGTFRFCKEKTVNCSDLYRLFICRTCGTDCGKNMFHPNLRCVKCGETLNFGEVQIPYCFKLLMQELRSMNIGTRFQL